jgi:hypothetical protein
MRRFFSPLFALLMLICNSAFLRAFELEVLGGYNGLSFNPYKIEAYSEPNKDKEFIYFPFFLANVNVRHNISEIMHLSFNFERDNVLQNSFSTIFGVKTDYINVDFGFFAGMADKITKPDAGIIGNLELIASKAVFLSISGSSTLGVKYGFTSNNFRETAGVKLGFWAGSTIPSFSADIKSFSRQVEDDIIIDDTLYRFLFNMDFLIKNTNTTGYFNTGYQVYSRVYKKDALEFTDALNSYLAGFGFHWHRKPMGFKIGVEVPFILSAVSPMTVTNNYLRFSKAYAGFVYSFDR